MDRMSVEEILEWLNRFAVIFKRPLQKCLLHFEHGPENALEQLKEDAGLPEFQRLVDKLQLALGKISIREAFDDLDSMMAFYFDQRKQEYTRMIDVKASWGRMIGFTPMYALIFLYLVIPLVGMSFLQMNIYYEQIQKL
jgi:KaiC/GvpD/RAD55 family RecA-like ATPase